MTAQARARSRSWEELTIPDSLGDQDQRTVALASMRFAELPRKQRAPMRSKA